MTPRQLLDEARSTERFLDRHRVRHERVCGCITGRFDDGRVCQPGRALLDTHHEARLRANALGWLLTDEPLIAENVLSIEFPGFAALVARERRLAS